MADPVYPPKLIYVRGAGVVLDDMLGTGYITLNPLVAPDTTLTQRQISASLIVDYNPDGSILGLELLWDAGQLNRPFIGPGAGAGGTPLSI